MNTENKILAGIVIIFLVVCSSLIVIELLNNSETTYHIYIEDCENFSMACGEKLELFELTFGNETIISEDLTEEILLKNCHNIQNQTWACGDYLVTDLLL